MLMQVVNPVATASGTPPASDSEEVVTEPEDAEPQDEPVPSVVESVPNSASKPSGEENVAHTQVNRCDIFCKVEHV